MATIFITGHKNPDNDTIAAAVAQAYFENELEKQKKEKDPSYEPDVYKAVCLGPLPAESAWVIKENGLEEPELISGVEPGQKIILVDHNESQQSVDGLKEAEIVGVIDHHRIGDLTTAAPLWMTFRPWGSTATIITTIFEQYGMEIPKGIAALLYSAVLTDTVILKSPTTTDVDKEVVEKLSAITGLDPKEYGQALFRQRGGEADIDIETYVTADSKEFSVAGKTVLVGQHETVDLAAAMEREEEARAYMKKVVEEKGYDFFLLMVTDILEEGSNFLVEGNHDVVDQVFGIDSSAAVWMPGVLSRKKQVAAPLLEV